VSDTVSFKINGKDVSVPKGWTVMRAAEREGVPIPHFCYHEGLSVAGVCRFCMVKVAGRPKMEIACNLQAVDGMEIDTISDEVKLVHKWGLELHLVNHPLDCPVCDQAGECELQDYYMEVGKYESQMTRPKVLKPKALDVGSQLVLDTERCILCSRCVRFEDEVTKTKGLGIFDRGDRAIIGTYEEEKIEHKYQENIVDICPVGAFTSKEFRFKQRVWFLKEKDAICTGCSTGCHVSVHGKPETGRYYRIKPRFDAEVNGHWMCDDGRHIYKYLNPEDRLSCAWYRDGNGERKRGTFDEGMTALAKKLQQTNPDDVALLVSAQQTCEEYDALFSYFVGKRKIKKIFQWRQENEKFADFDGILKRGDENPNTAGLIKSLQNFGVTTAIKNQFEDCLLSGAKLVIAITPENPAGFPDLRGQLAKLGELPFVSVWSTNYFAEEIDTIPHAIPLKGFAEKTGTFLNFKNQEGKLNDPFPSAIHAAKDVGEVVAALATLMQSADSSR
jgi:NADH-quinone oxidoreductase subunit G